VETLYPAVAAGFEGGALPPFVRRELEGYLDCGLLCRGFARLKCESCSEQHLVAFACKGRGAALVLRAAPFPLLCAARVMRCASQPASVI
jgi:hypothetical protein